MINFLTCFAYAITAPCARRRYGLPQLLARVQHQSRHSKHGELIRLDHVHLVLQADPHSLYLAASRRARDQTLRAGGGRQLDLVMNCRMLCGRNE